ncbi:MAG: GatB/YqeY domain-containing protein [bacterium]|nr:GatB/YqeY domain-containing protein [bacterium]
MSIQEQITTDTKEAMKASDSAKVTTLRGLSSVLKNKSIELQKDGLSDEEAVSALSTEGKKRKESIKVFEGAGRLEMAEAEKKELEIIEGYLPELMSEEETKSKIAAILDSKEFDNFGAAMKEIMAELKGKADAKLVSEIVKGKFNS